MADVQIISGTEVNADYWQPKYAWKAVSSGPDVVYCFYLDDADDDFKVRKSADGGGTWGTATTLYAGTVAAFDLVEGWSVNADATDVHIAMADSTVDNVIYFTYDTADDSDGGEDETAFNAVSVFGPGSTVLLSISLNEAGNPGILYNVDEGAEYGFVKRSGGGSWSSGADLFAETDVDENQNFKLLPLPTGLNDQASPQTADRCAMVIDPTNDDLELWVYDDSADDWVEHTGSPIDNAGMASANPKYMQLDGVLNLNDDLIYFVWINAIDTATADYKSAQLTNSTTITAKTDISTNNNDMVTVSLNVNHQNGDMTAFTVDGSFFTSVTVQKSKTTDEGTTWGSLTAYQEDTGGDLRVQACCQYIGNGGGRVGAVFHDRTADDVRWNKTNAEQISAAAGAAGQPTMRRWGGVPGMTPGPASGTRSW